MRNKIHDFVGSVGAIIGLLVFLAYIPQIISNLNGEKGQPWQPLVAAISFLLLVIYGFTTEPKKYYILIVPNVACVVFVMITFFTSL